MAGALPAGDGPVLEPGAHAAAVARLHPRGRHPERTARATVVRVRSEHVAPEGVRPGGRADVDPAAGEREPAAAGARGALGRARETRRRGRREPEDASFAAHRAELLVDRAVQPEREVRAV